MILASRGKHGIVAALSAALSFGGGYVLAQDDPDAEIPGLDEEAPAEETEPKPRETLSPEEMSKRAKALIAEMDEVFKKTIGLQEIAKKEKDVIKLNCVADKVAQIKQLRALANSAQASLEEAIVRRDEDARYHEFERLSIIHQQVAALGAEAEACVGEDLTYMGETDVDVDQPEGEEDIQEEPEIPEIELPPVGSPWV